MLTYWLGMLANTGGRIVPVGKTLTVTVSVVVSAGVALSDTITVIGVAPVAWPAAGVQVTTPVVVLILTPDGAPAPKL